MQRRAKKSGKRKDERPVRLAIRNEGKTIGEIKRGQAAWRLEEKTKKYEENYCGVQSFSNFMFRPLEFYKTINTPKNKVQSYILVLFFK